MTVWIYTVICVGSLWCIPEHDRRSASVFQTKEECLRVGREKQDYVLKRGWIIRCDEYEKFSEGPRP